MVCTISGQVKKDKKEQKNRLRRYKKQAIGKAWYGK
jgi:hypothetical protein